MTDQMLPDLAALPASAAQVVDHSQWRIDSLQMVNWGGFHGHHPVTFAEGSTLLSGASGTGKSTLLDAYIALMMPHDTPFNGASNDAGGRARSAEQRNLLTYLRGKTDTSRVDGSDEMRDQVLRGRDGGHVWGGLAGTFVNDAGRKFTVLRLYFVRAGAKVNGDVTTAFATYEGYFDLRDATSLANSRFDKRSLRAVGLDPHDGFGKFRETIATRLGIGGPDGGVKAMRLLARVQAGMEVKRVDDLYKTMVLERPATYEAADTAIKHFADLKASYAKMLDETNKVKALQRLPELQVELHRAETDGAVIAALGVHRDGPTPFQLWRLRTERALLDQAVEVNRSDVKRGSERLRQASIDEARLAERLGAIADAKRANGGDAIDRLTRELQRLRTVKEDAYTKSIKFGERTGVLGVPDPSTGDEFAQMRLDAEAFLAGFDERIRELRDQEDALREDQAPLTSQRGELRAELASLRGRRSGVPRRLHEARLKMAEAAGMRESDLPFVAELIDVLPDEEHWRKAIETTLGGLARTVLVDRNLRTRFSQAIDPLRLTPRIRFEAVDLKPFTQVEADSNFVSGKLAYADSPFADWVQERVTSHRVDHLCVATARDLDGGREPRVTPAGQTRDGDRGAHGDSGDGSIIGFSNTRRLADIQAELDELEPQIAALQVSIDAVRSKQSSLQLRKEAHTFVIDTVWEAIDHAGVAARITAVEQQIADLRAASSILDQLQREEDEVKAEHAEVNRDKVLSQKHLDDLQAAYADLVDDQDAVQDVLDKIDRDQSTHVTDEQQAWLDQLFASGWDTADLKGFHTNMRALGKRIAEQASAAEESKRRAERSMESLFENFQQRWPEPNLGVTTASAAGYREIYDRIVTEGLHERRQRWREQFAAWSSDDLLMLNTAYDTALEEIEDRLVPINKILHTLPFGGKGVLQIHSRRMASDQVQAFRRELRALSSGVSDEMTETQVEQRFAKLNTFMERITIPEGHTKASTSQRDRYLDVRNHVVITAVCLNDVGNEIATYDSLGGKSGGETQELVAFIVGSALRYQLGDETRSRPRFAPVFLDEGFVKADSEFAGRAVSAWQKLGFQLIVGAPLDKVTALEPYMGLILSVTKSDRGYSKVADLRDAPAGGPA